MTSTWSGGQYSSSEDLNDNKAVFWSTYETILLTLPIFFLRQIATDPNLMRDNLLQKIFQNLFHKANLVSCLPDDRLPCGKLDWQYRKHHFFSGKQVAEI